VEEAVSERQQKTPSYENELAAYFDRCAREGDMAAFDSDERRRLDLFLEEWAIRPGERVLEPGCGSGRLTAVLAGAVGKAGHVLAMDLSPGMVSKARRRGLPHNVRVLRGSVLQIPEADDSFDTIICLCVFPHFPDKRAVLREFARVLRPGGDLWINHFASREAINEFHSGLDPAVADHLIPPDDEVHRLLEEAGFDVVSHRQDDPGYRLHAVRRA
jgi:demethylmenaquinone methyltransferase/2-methoxy-6-polyprenyl-1,4-benzoquinol methylase